MRKLNQLRKSGTDRERDFAERFLDAYAAKVPQDGRWRKAQMRWEEMVKAQLRDPSIDEEQAESLAIDVLLTLLDLADPHAQRGRKR